MTAFEFIAQPEKLYRAADAFVLTSRSEAFGLAAYEALACGLPLVLTATMGLLSLRELNFSGIEWLPNPAEHGDISVEIAEALRRIWSAPPFDAAARRAETERWFDLDAQFEKLVAVYRHLAEGGREPGRFADRVERAE